jgi:3-hydroxyacyl-CoA dehydrogenase/enoyl-CoA hydratase/3-hydroxybutyryl-CoA epimerase/3-hydroxyacyl-CoA dehydrogenase/enoyl-CoA hydratase/3-hydroxybutyryl-CoA epimerase/enoyl-CoA isomerase
MEHCASREKSMTPDPASIVRAGVLGAGQMGAGIAGTLVRSGILTTLVDVNPAMLDAATKRVRQIATRPAGNAGPAQNSHAPRLETSTDLMALARCEVLIEAVTENEEIKCGLFRSLTGVLGERAIVASNTSTIPISRMAGSWPYGDRFAGMHFFHPAHRMELVEVIRGERTSDGTIATLVALARQVGKSPIVARDGPGFLTTRVLFPYLSQAIELLEEGAAMAEIDAAAVRFGMATGPIALLDFVGLDTALGIGKVMSAAFPDRFAVNPLLIDLVSLGRLGRKSGAGFRTYEQPGSAGVLDPAFEALLMRHRRDREPPSEEESVDRLFLAMLLEAIRALEEGIVQGAADLDRSVVLGLGFPAARGGILTWCEREGPRNILDRVARYNSLGPAFHPPVTLRLMGARTRSFRIP